MNLFMCCMPRRKMMVSEDFSELGNFERFSQNKISLRRENLKTRNITGMSKFRAIQKLKRKMENMQSKTMPKPKMEKIKEFPKKRHRRSLSQPTLTVKNYVPYDY